MRPAEQPAEIAGVGHPNPPGNLSHRKIRVGQQAALVINGADDWDRLSFDARRALIRATVECAAVTKHGRGAERVRVKLFGE